MVFRSSPRIAGNIDSLADGLQRLVRPLNTTLAGIVILIDDSNSGTCVLQEDPENTVRCSTLWAKSMMDILKTKNKELSLGVEMLMLHELGHHRTSGLLRQVRTDLEKITFVNPGDKVNIAFMMRKVENFKDSEFYLRFGRSELAAELYALTKVGNASDAIVSEIAVIVICSMKDPEHRQRSGEAYADYVGRKAREALLHRASVDVR